MCAHQSPHLEQRLILTNEANPKTKSTSQVENTNTLHAKDVESTFQYETNISARH